MRGVLGSAAWMERNRHLEKCSLSDLSDLSPEAAINLAGILRQSGAHTLARRVLRKHVVF
jgi:hypothetical protein